jgi:hypothetical protein
MGGVVRARLSPFFPYYGSAWSKARKLPAPSFDVVEPFAGAAGYSTFYGVRRALLIDADPIIAELWKYLIRVTADEIMALPEMPEVGDHVDNYSVPQEAKWLIGFWLNRGSATPKKSRTAYSSRCDGAQLNWGRKAKERIASQLPAIAEWRVIEGGYENAPHECRSWFVDPPYADKGKFYRVKFDSFAELAAWCLSRQGELIVCEAEGADWLPFVSLGQFKSSTGKSSEAIYIRGAAQGLLFEEAA